MQETVVNKYAHCSPGTMCSTQFLLKDCCLWKGPMLEQGKMVRRRELQRGTITERSKLPFPIPFHWLRRTDVAEWKTKVSLGKRERWQEDGVLICLCFSLSKPILIGNTLFPTSWDCFAHDNYWSSCYYCKPSGFAFNLLPMWCWGGSCVGVWVLAKVNPPQLFFILLYLIVLLAVVLWHKIL